MSLLRSYSFGIMFGVTELPTGILNLFVGLPPEKPIEYASEIISSGLQGRIDLDSEFNLEAYEAAIRKNQRLGIEGKRGRELFLDFSDNSDDWEETVRGGGIKVDNATTSAVDKMEDAYEQLMEEDELRYAVETIKSLQPVLLIESKVDFIQTVRQALKGIPESLNILKKICEEYEIVAEQVKIVLGSGKEFDSLFV